jgi:carboxyl-terminal processing protease
VTTRPEAAAPRGPRRRWAALIAALCLAGAQDNVQLRSFDEVYTRVNAVHPRPDQLGPAWEAAYQRLRPQAAQAESNAAVAIPIHELLRTLPGRHHALLRSGGEPPAPPPPPAPAPSAPDPAASAPHPAAAAPSAPAPAAGPTGPAAPAAPPPPPLAQRPPAPFFPGERGMPGLLPLEVDGAVRVAWLAPGGPAAQAGVQLGDHIESVDGAPCPADPACLAPERAPGGALQLTLRPAAGGPPRTLTLAADQPRVVVTPPIGAAPAMRTLSWSAQLPLATGGHAELLGLSAMSVAAGQRIHDRLGRLQAEGARGLILDLRENPGGLVQLASAVGSYLFAGPTALGALRTRADTLTFRTFQKPPSQVFTGPVAVLVSPGTGSTAELVAGALQELGRARVFGATSMGAVESALIEPLPNGDRLQLVIATIELPSGAALEGAGVRPDEALPDPARRGARGQDQTLQAALSWIDQRR